MNPGMKKCWDKVAPFLISFGFDEYVSAVENLSPDSSN